MRREREEREETQESRPKKKRRRFGRFRFYFVNIFLGVVIALLAVCIFVYFCCRVQTVEVEGSTLYTQQQIQDYVLDGTYSYNSVYAVADNLIHPKENITFVKSVKVRMTGLNALKITVTEKKMIGYVTLADGTYAYFDRDGVVQEVSDRLLEGLLPVGGISCEKARAGDELPVDEEILTYLTALLKGLEKYEITPEEITFSDDGSAIVQYQGIQILLGKQTDLEEKLMRLPKILPYLEGMTGILHLENWSRDNTDIVFKNVPQTEG